MCSRFVLTVATLGATAWPALAHPEHGSDAGSVAAGFAHPLLGIDHVLVAVAVGVWAVVLGGRAVWNVPAAFVLGLLGGFVLAVAGVSLPWVEPGIAASVLVLGLLVAAAIRLPLAPSMFSVGLFAMLHGHAHGAGVSGASLTFGLGLAAATILLHVTGIGLGRVLAGPRLMLARSLGGTVAGVGLLLLGGWA